MKNFLTILTLVVCLATLTPAADACPPRVCLGDFDGSGVMDEDDLFAFIDAWMAVDLCADLNQNGGIDYDDLWIFIGVYFRGCR